MELPIIFKGILCEIEEGAKIVNTSHALQIISYYSLTSTYLCLRSSLSFGARSNSFLASTSLYLVVVS